MDDLTMKRIKEFERKCYLYEKFSKKNYLMANIFIECCKRHVNMFELLMELHAYLVNRKGPEDTVMFHAELLMEYFTVCYKSKVIHSHFNHCESNNV